MKIKESGIRQQGNQELGKLDCLPIKPNYLISDYLIPYFVISNNFSSFL
jgi:hypothetical protein